MAPSRLFWFLIGAGTATWWIKRPFYPYNHRENGHVTYGRWSVRQEGDEEPQISEMIRRWDFGGEDDERRKEIVREWSQMAGDRAAELTEVTLDALSSLTQTLQAKLAEHRATREAEERRRREAFESQPQRPRSASEPHQRWV